MIDAFYLLFQELISSDRDCAIKLLEYRGPRMEPQKLDSILEEHIKLRSYMRTKQTKDQIKAYQQVSYIPNIWFYRIIDDYIAL